MKYCTACQKTYPTDRDVCPTDNTRLLVAHELQPGMIIRNKYQIIERIGIGGMGLVYRGRHLTFNELCAIKIVNDDIAGNANFLKRFQTEAIVTRKLRHPNAVRVDDFDYTDDGRPFIVMELVEGKNVSEVLQKEGALAVPRAIRIARQVGQAIGMAHKLGIVHRDLKPANIILTTDEHGQEIAKVLDFGIAKLREAAGEDRPEMTMTGMVVGTPLYMSPEQFLGKKAGGEVDGRTDIYSLGVVLYQMITAQLPFDAETPYALMLQHMQGTVLPPHELKPDLHIPMALSQVILRAMEKSREQRFQTAEEFVAALDQVAVSSVASEALGSATPNPGMRAVPTPSPAGVAVPVPTTGHAPTAVNAEPRATIVQSAAALDPALVSSAAQHVFLPPRGLTAKLLLRFLIVGLAAILVAGAGYLKFRSARRVRISGEVMEKLKVASASLPGADLRVSVSDDRDVTLDGAVRAAEEASLAESLASSVPGVIHVRNRLIVVPTVPTETTESLVNKGVSFLDAGDYASAIDCFRKALADPNNKGAQELLDRAQRAQQTEEELLKNRQ
ncbi:MAG TPA: protein kinase [Candidatus Polarisedimenticolia bacterium]|nr:protein kinase [Candidatus Polarisedimenticolia bacterium]